MFNTLTEKLNSAFHVHKGHGKITEINALSPIQTLFVAGMIEKKDATLVELYLLI